MIDDLKPDRPERLTVFYRQILEAELKKDAARIEKILPSIEDLRCAWAKIAAKSDEI